MFKSEEELLFSGQYWATLGTSIERIVSGVDGLEMQGDQIWDSYARRAVEWNTLEVDGPLPLRKNCKWVIGISFLERGIEYWKRHIRSWFTSQKH